MSSSARGWVRDPINDDDEKDYDKEEMPLRQKQGSFSYFSFGQQSSQSSRGLIWGGALFAAFWIVGITTYLVLRHMFARDNDLSVCYVENSCPAGNTVPYDSTTGFTNDTGWSSSASTADECCQICLPGTSVVNCFDSTDTNCTSKTGLGDYDYLLFDQIWLPQLCAALDQGHDPTLTHMQGTSCLASSAWYSKLGIHGLWPNYYGGYPGCCPVVQSYAEAASVSESSSYIPLTPSEVAEWAISEELQAKWIDPTASDVNDCSTCSMWNHEWQKHGACFSTSFTDTSQQDYFNTSLAMFDVLWKYTEQVNAMSEQTVTTSSIANMYPKRVNVVCDPKDTNSMNDADTKVFLELQTCWQHASDDVDLLRELKTPFVVVRESVYAMVNCSAAAQLPFTTPCPTNVYIP
jgi:ribonuclease T2